ncbi:MAG: AMP-binding protein [Chloroflexi bacterium]|nr:AMP-binding protein [Chloroflexota bacterium]
MHQATPSILAAFVAYATTTPARACLIWEGRTTSYGELLSLAGDWAAAFTGMGVQRGDRVGLFLPSSPAFLGAYLGAQLCGAAVVLINTQYRQAELSHILADSAPRVVVTDEPGAALVAQAAESSQGAPATLRLPTGAPLPTTVHAGAGQSLLARLPDGLPQAGDLAILAYTSGTTGRAKGAMLTHGCLAANSAAVTTAWRWTASDRLLLTLPLFHIHGLGVGVHGTLLSGASLALWPRFEPDEVLQALASGASTLFFGVPTMYTRLIAAAQAAPQLARQAGQAVRLFVSGSAPLAPQTFAAFEQLFGQRILERYGMTETGMNLTNPYDGERRPGTVGMPFPGQEARVVDLQTRAPLPDGTIGEIQVRGPHVCAGYWRNPTATAEVFHPDGWFSTGDLGWRSADGYYTITGRARELIISGGYNIYPREVEETLLAHPGVAECAVFGLPDPEFGERVAAAIVPHDPATPPTAEELEAFCRERLAAYKRPRVVYHVASLPRNALGKVQKHELRAQLVV